MRNCLLIVFMLFPFSLFGQTNFVKGYIVKTNGDIQRGYVNYGTNIENNKHCLFKPDSLSDAVEYLPGQITGYRIDDDKYYVTKTIDTNKGKQALFLECIISGKVSIYFYNNGDKEIYFAEKDGLLTPMNNDLRSTVDAEGEQYMEHSNQYKGVLKYDFRDCPEIIRQVNRTEFNKKSLINIAKEYHEFVCKDQDCIVYEKEFSEKRKLKYGLEIGNTVTKINYSSRIAYGGATYPKFFFDGVSYIQPSFSFFVQTVLDENDRYVFRLNSGISYCQVEITSPSYTIMIKSVLPQNMQDVQYFFDKINYKFYNLSIKPDIIERFRVLKKNRPFIFFGIPVSYIVSDSGYALYNVRKIPFTTNSYNGFVLKKSYGWSWGLDGGLGIEKSLNDKYTGYISSHMMMMNVGDGVIDVWGGGLNIGLYF